MEDIKDYIKKLSLKTIDELRDVVERYMKYEVDGDMFVNEEAFENAVRAMLKQSGFEVFDKEDVANAIKEISERHFSSDVNRQIPDISIQCREGLVFLELKFKNTPAAYQADIEKVANYLKQGKCVAAGILFLDETRYPDWAQCVKNRKYFYLWRLGKKHLA